VHEQVRQEALEQVHHEREPALHRASPLLPLVPLVARPRPAHSRLTLLLPQSNEAIDFLDHLLRYDHQERATAKELLDSPGHAYFNPVREAEAAAKAGKAEGK